ncbi:arsenic resistance N-acetyltransferase ArsN2 [Pandoraea pnomenusa]|uniref:Amino-acid acetyltransferase n=1 Tax=Pandoraea morbifera TaxID=2508300 RepID=A0A5E4XK85_9BURK|nr:arsenic resistance N-acetyltransferase ArsN2 [Pandoraea morbifera]VVE36736.1 Amino-acid acetyltransferase [Pandoraea morbifera]
MNDSSIMIRPARVDEIPQIRALLAKCELPWEDVTESAGIGFLVAVATDGCIVGSVGLELSGTVGLLRSLAVAEEVRGVKIGQALVAAAEAKAREQAVDALYLLTTTASKFFARRGYDVVDRGGAPEVLQRSSQFTSICPASAICMVRANS